MPCVKRKKLNPIPRSIDILILLLVHLKLFGLVVPNHHQVSAKPRSLGHYAVCTVLECKLELTPQYHGNDWVLEEVGHAHLPPVAVVQLDPASDVENES